MVGVYIVFLSLYNFAVVLGSRSAGFLSHGEESPNTRLGFFSRQQGSG